MVLERKGSLPDFESWKFFQVNFNFIPGKLVDKTTYLFTGWPIDIVDQVTVAQLTGWRIDGVLLRLTNWRLTNWQLTNRRLTNWHSVILNNILGYSGRSLTRNLPESSWIKLINFDINQWILIYGLLINRCTKIHPNYNNLKLPVVLLTHLWITWQINWNSYKWKTG